MLASTQVGGLFRKSFPVSKLRSEFNTPRYEKIFFYGQLNLTSFKKVTK